MLMINFLLYLFSKYLLGSYSGPTLICVLTECQNGGGEDNAFYFKYRETKAGQSTWQDATASVLIFFFLVLGIEAKASHVISLDSATDHQSLFPPQFSFGSLWGYQSMFFYTHVLKN